MITHRVAKNSRVLIDFEQPITTAELWASGVKEPVSLPVRDGVAILDGPDWFKVWEENEMEVRTDVGNAQILVVKQ